jgi:hypothetical protein
MKRAPRMRSWAWCGLQQFQRPVSQRKALATVGAGGAGRSRHGEVRHFPGLRAVGAISEVALDRWGPTPGKASRAVTSQQQRPRNPKLTWARSGGTNHRASGLARSRKFVVADVAASAQQGLRTMGSFRRAIRVSPAFATGGGFRLAATRSQRTRDAQANIALRNSVRGRTFEALGTVRIFGAAADREGAVALLLQTIPSPKVGPGVLRLAACARVSTLPQFPAGVTTLHNESA